MKTLNEIKDKYLGEIGTEERDQFENDLRMDILGEMIKKLRKDRKLTQEQLGKMIGVQKSQISKLENNTKNIRFGTIQKVFAALNAKVKLTFEADNQEIEIA
jgi:transcriptional regulator with XRE-family HTH domain